jgi:hypothetical protein
VGPSKKKNNGYHKNYTKTHEAKWLLEFIGGKYDCAGKASSKWWTCPLIGDGSPYRQTRNWLIIIKYCFWDQLGA